MDDVPTCTVVVSDHLQHKLRQPQGRFLGEKFSHPQLHAHTSYLGHPTLRKNQLHFFSNTIAVKKFQGIMIYLVLSSTIANLNFSKNLIPELRVCFDIGK